MGDISKHIDALSKSVDRAGSMDFAVQKALGDISKSAAWMSHSQSIVQAVEDAVRRHQEALNLGDSIQNAIANAVDIQFMIDDSHKRLAAFYSSIDHSTQWQKSLDKVVATTQRSLEAPLAQSIAVWQADAIARSKFVENATIAAIGSDLEERLFIPNQVFADFANDTVLRMTDLVDARQLWALEHSLSVAEKQLIATTSLIAKFPFEAMEQVSPVPEITLRLPFQMREEFIQAAHDKNIIDEQGLLLWSPASQSAELAREVLLLITQCNEAALLAGQMEFFKPTTRILAVYVDLPLLAPVDKRSFGDFVDCFYYLFYEGAGKDKLRYHKQFDGPLDDDECNLIWCIKHLRNKWTRHDPDHGAEKNIRKSWDELAVKFEWLGLTQLPATPNDFQQMQRRLLELAIEFLTLILSRLTLKK
jgi:hypothetical protein